MKPRSVCQLQLQIGKWEKQIKVFSIHGRDIRNCEKFSLEKKSLMGCSVSSQVISTPAHVESQHQPFHRLGSQWDVRSSLLTHKHAPTHPKLFREPGDHHTCTSVQVRNVLSNQPSWPFPFFDVQKGVWEHVLWIPLGWNQATCSNAPLLNRHSALRTKLIWNFPPETHTVWISGLSTISPSTFPALDNLLKQKHWKISLVLIYRW